MMTVRLRQLVHVLPPVNMLLARQMSAASILDRPIYATALLPTPDFSIWNDRDGNDRPERMAAFRLAS